ncbi:MAG TPA: class I SAM-dependent methyltransferase [Bacteroidales bacterium]|nr:class I SAM-dependent methyltransferase [Bacteroidales bacterium]
MNNAFRIREFIRYKLKAQSEYKIHSPFAYDFYTKVVISKQKLPECLLEVEKIRKECLRLPEKIAVTDLGTGAGIKPAERKIQDIMRRYSNSKKDAFLLYRMVKYLKPSQILELGTSLGISTMYLSMADKQIPVTTIEACTQTAELARKNFEKLSLPVNLILGDLNQILIPTLKKTGVPELVFFDGNHTKEATLQYFDACHLLMKDPFLFLMIFTGLPA